MQLRAPLDGPNLKSSARGLPGRSWLAQFLAVVVVVSVACGTPETVGPESTAEASVRATSPDSEVTRDSANQATSPDPTVLPGKIAFWSPKDGNEEIYLVNPDGSGEVRLTDHSATDREPTWSPDGKRIAFATNRDGNFESYVMNVDGSNMARVTQDPARDWGPEWSPEGSKIAFVSDESIHVVNPDGSNRRRVSAGSGRGPIWSPDGSQIAYSGSDAIYVVESDGSNEFRLSASVWSGDQASLELAVNRWREDVELRSTWPILEGGEECLGAVDPVTGTLVEPGCNPFIDIAALAEHGLIRNSASVESADTSRNTTATNSRSGPHGWFLDGLGTLQAIPAVLDGHWARDPVWSPDGSKIAYARSSIGGGQSADLMIVDSDGSNTTLVTQIPQFRESLTWSPDEARIAFVSDLEIQTVRPDGSDLVRLGVLEDSVDTVPAWSADGSMIAFGCDNRGSRELCVMNSDGSDKRRLTALGTTFSGRNGPVWSTR